MKRKKCGEDCMADCAKVSSLVHQVEELTEERDRWSKTAWSLFSRESAMTLLINEELHKLVMQTVNADTRFNDLYDSSITTTFRCKDENRADVVFYMRYYKMNEMEKKEAQDIIGEWQDSLMKAVGNSQFLRTFFYSLQIVIKVHVGKK